MKVAVVAVLLAGLGLTGCAGLTDQPGAGSSPSAAGTSGPDRGCVTATARHFELCTAYIANATVAARYPYYQFGHGGNQTLARAAASRLRSRYTGAALAFLLRQTADWPGGLHVRLPDVHIDSVSVAADQNTAVLRTHESWRVETRTGQLLFAETDHAHTITLQRVPGVILHKWVVSDIR